VGRFTDVDGKAAVFALPNETHRSYCEEVRLDVEAALATRFGTAVPIRLVVDDEASEEPVPSRTSQPAQGPQSSAEASAPAAPSPSRVRSPRGAASAASTTVVESVDSQADDSPDLLDPAVLATETEPAGAGLTPEERLKQAFPGAHEV
jgi:hypothetical protein